MKQKLLIITMGLFTLSGCAQKEKNSKSSLASTETGSAKKTSFDTGLIDEIKKLTKTNAKQLPAIDQETGEILESKYDGVYFDTTHEKAIAIVRSLKPKFRENGYLIFVFEGDNDIKGVAVIKGTDDLDILRYRRTDGINYDLENADIVAKISEWKSKYGLTVIGCSRDWVQVEFDTLPTNLDAFADEVYKFCPDSVDQGVETLENLKLAIKEMNGVFLWWD
jgi:hypothetical protein